jgi:thymidylate kinase
VYYIEGNVGVGKSECAQSVTKLLREKGVKAKFLDSNLTDSIKKYGASLDRKSVACYGALPSYIAQHEFIITEGHAYDVLLVERHPTTSVEVFANADDLRLLYDSVGSLTAAAPANTIYIKNSPQVCYHRTMVRNRYGEQSLCEEDFTLWDKRHEEMMRKREALGGKVYVLDAFGAESHLLSPEIAGFIGFF